MPGGADPKKRGVSSDEPGGEAGLELVTTGGLGDVAACPPPVMSTVPSADQAKTSESVPPSLSSAVRCSAV